MRIDIAPTRAASVPSTNSSGMLSEWRIGAVLEAVAVRDALTGQLWLNIGNTRYAARIASGDANGPANGEKLQVRVMRSSPVLAVETLDGAADANAADDVTTSALRVFMPRQTSPSLLLANLAWLAGDDANGANLPKSVTQAAQTLWQALPQAEDLADPRTLEKAITQSGTFLESKLATQSPAQGSAAVTADLKTLMLTLNQALRMQGARPSAANPVRREDSQMPSPHAPLTSLQTGPATLSLLDTVSQQMNELAQHTEGAIARLTTLQIAGTPQDPNSQAVVIELPIRQDGRASIARLRIERDRPGSTSGVAEADDVWTVEAALDLGASGALHARVSMAKQRVSVQLRADSPAIVESLLAHSNQLGDTLREIGLSVDRVVCLHGMPAGDAAPSGQRLVDLRA
jgi:Flagellar hook-length control protein FliK